MIQKVISLSIVAIVFFLMIRKQLGALALYASKIMLKYGYVKIAFRVRKVADILSGKRKKDPCCH